MNIEITSKKSKILHIQVKLDLENYVGWGGGFTKKVRPGIYSEGGIYTKRAGFHSFLDYLKIRGIETG